MDEHLNGIWMAWYRSGAGWGHGCFRWGSWSPEGWLLLMESASASSPVRHVATVRPRA